MINSTGVKRMILCLLAIVIGLTAVVMVRSARSQDAPNESIFDEQAVQLSVACGTLKGTGAVVIIDKKQNKMYKLPFTCPAFTI